MSSFVVDTNFFIQAHRAYYPIDVVPSFWERVCNLSNNEKIISIDKVRSEIYRNEDQLKNWCIGNLNDTFFKATDGVIDAYSDVVNFAQSMSHHYTPHALNQFMQAEHADSWLVSYALYNKVGLVTYETSEPNRKKTIKIPDVCNYFGIRFLTPIQMFRELGVTF